MADNVKTGVYTQNDGDFKIDIKTTISAADKALFVKIASGLLFDKDGNYYSILKDMMFDFALAAMFTNLHTDYIFESEDIYEEIEEFIGDSNVADIVIANAEYGLIDELRSAVNDNIEYRTGICNDSISKSFSRLLDTLDEKVSNINFDLNDDNVSDILKAMTNIPGELNLENMLDAYLKTDAFKGQPDSKKDVENKNISALSPIV